MTNKLISHVGLFAVVFGFYALVFQGHYLSIDELYIYDSAESFIDRGNFLLNQTFNVNAFTSAPIQAIHSHGQPWLAPNHEPLMLVLVAPFVGLAKLIPGIGNMHFVWLFNLFIVSITSVSIYYIGVRQGIQSKVAWYGGLLFAISTNTAFYGRLLFREPLMGLLILWTFAIALKMNHSKSMTKTSSIMLLLLLVAAFLVKTVALLLLPSLLLILFPLLWRFGWRNSSMVILIGAVLIGIVILLGANAFGTRYTFDPYISRLQRTSWEFVLESFLAYQVSPGRSLWLYSPTLLLMFPGAWFLLKQGQWRNVFAMFIVIWSFAIGYGISHAHDWMGGWGWGPRYLMPLIPILMLYLVLPALEHLITSQRGRFLVYVVIVTGIMVQIIGFAVPLSNYYTDVFRAGKYYDYDNYVAANLHWMGVNWDLRWAPLYYHLERWSFPRLDIAWRVAEMPAIPLAFAVGLIITGFSARKANWTVSVRHSIFYMTLSLSLILGFMTTALISLRNDPRVIGEWPDVRDLAAELNDVASDDDIILLDRALYTDIFMNYQKTSATLVTLPYATVEFTDDPLATAPTAEQIGVGTLAALNWLSGQYRSIWLVASSSPFETNKQRPIEKYLAFHYFSVEELTISPRARAIRYLPVEAPSGEPENILNEVYKPGLELLGFDLPLGMQINVQDGLPVSLTWQVHEPLDFDYNIGLLLMDSTGVVQAERNGPPQGTFGKMSTWVSGVNYRDNHGLWKLQPGHYQLILVVYNWQTGERLQLENGSDMLPLATIDVK